MSRENKDNITTNMEFVFKRAEKCINIHNQLIQHFNENQFK